MKKDRINFMKFSGQCRKLFGVLAFVLVTLSGGYANVFAVRQHQTISLDLDNVAPVVVFEQIESQSNFKFFYKTAQIEGLNKISIHSKAASIPDVLQELQKKTGLQYKIFESQIIVLPAKPEPSNPQDNKIVVKGRVTDSNGLGMPGVAIMVKGTTTGVTTDANGNYTIKVDPKSFLVFTFLGMKTQTLAVPQNGIVNVTLQESAEALDEVVVTGYGNYKKSTYTGSASVIETKKLESLPLTSVSQMMEANLPGVTLSSTSSQPGATTSIRVRGLGSFNASSEPLYILDGIPISSGNMSSDPSSTGGLGTLALLNPDDIENITVLKDAASASLYGARGANGVILITTKKGKEGKTRYDFKASFGFTDLAYTYREIMGGEERRDLLYEGFTNRQIDEGKSEAEQIKYAESQTDIYAKKPAGGYSDWIGALFKQGYSQDYNFSVTGGTANNNFSGGVGYTKSDGVTLNSGLERFSGRLGFNNKYKNFEFSMNSISSLTRNKMTPESNADDGTLYYASAVYTSRVTLTPSDPIFNEDGTYNTALPNNGNNNPIYENQLNNYYTQVAKTINTLTAGYNIIKGLKLATTFSADYALTKEFRYWSPLSADGKEANGRARMGMYENLRYNSNTILTFNKTFKDHTIDAAVAYEIQKWQHEDLYAAAKGYGQNINQSLSNASTPTSVVQLIKGDGMLSYVGKLNYDYKNRYYAGFSFRRDGSSRLAPSNRWDNFWAVSGSWRVSSEKFMLVTSEWLNDLKVRASYGVNGNLPSDLYAYHGVYSTQRSYNGESAIAESSMPNDALSWEKNYATNIGVDFTLFRRLNVTFDWYKRITRDLLMNKQINTMSGFSSILSNIGKMENKGIEIEIRSTNIQTKDFQWTSYLNLAHNKNKILKLADEKEYEAASVFVRKEGYSFGTLKLREYAGVDPDNGKPMYYKNTLEDGVYNRDIVYDPNQAKSIPVRDIYPKLTGGFSNTFSYKFIDLSFNLSFSLGGWSYDGGMYALQDDGYSNSRNKSVKLRDRWKKPGDITDVPRYVEGQEFGGYWHSTRGIHSTDHLRLKSLILGVSAPKKWLAASGLSQARIYFSGTNLLTWAAYDQYDPELLGRVVFNVPPLKTFAFGVEFGF